MKNFEQIIAVTFDHKGEQDRAEQLAGEMDLPMTTPESREYSLLLAVTPTRLELRQIGKQAPGPLFVDFTAGAVDFRRRHGGGRKQPLARAVGLKANKCPLVVDMTAGLGRDSFVLASLGCQVHLIERSPVIAALLADGLARAAADPEVGEMIRQKMHLHVGSSMEIVGDWQDARPEVIYLDPMYPHRTKSALVKKEMRILRMVVGYDEDAPLLLRAALRCARDRVVVKRPRLAPQVEGRDPSFVITGKKSRFDVYLTENQGRP